VGLFAAVNRRLEVQRGGVEMNRARVYTLRSLRTIDRFLAPKRLQRTPTRLFGPKNRTNHRRIEINITFDCNLKCSNCNRSCSQAPAEDHMTLEQMERFIKESQQKTRKWEQIVLMGGEPTVHPAILEIVDMLVSYRRQVNHEVKLILATNGFGPEAKGVLCQLPSDIGIRNARKKSALQKEFYPFNLAPVDFQVYKNADYSNKCDVTWTCGPGLSRYGYYLCSNASGIDRVFGMDIGRRELPSTDDQMIDQAERLCRFCGRFRVYRGVAHGELISPVWKTAYEKYRRQRPILTEY